MPPIPEFVSDDYQQLHKDIRRFVHSQLQSTADVEDLVQEAFTRWLAMLKYQSQAPRPLLFRIAHNLLCDYWRRQKVRQGSGLVALDHTTAEEDHPTTAGPLAMVQQQQRLQWLAQALESLPPKCKHAFVLHKFDGLTHAAIAEQMDISISMVEKHIARAMLHCKRFIDERRRAEGTRH